MNQIPKNAMKFDPQQFAELFNKNLNDTLAANLIDFEVSSLWWDAAQASLILSSMRSIGLPGKKFLEIRKKINEKQPLDYFTFAVVNNTLEEMTEEQLAKWLCSGSYDDLLIEISDLAVKFNEFHDSLKDPVTEMTVKQLNSNVSDNKVVNMKPAE